MLAKRRSSSLKHTLGAALAVLALLSATASTSLVLITRDLDQTNAAISSTLARHDRTEDATQRLLLHDRATTSDVRDRLARDVRSALDEVVRDAPKGVEADLAMRARASGDVHLEGRDAVGDAHDALRDLGEIQRARIADQRDDARTLHDGAHVMGVATSALVIAATILLLLAVNRRIVRPLLAVANAMRKFGDGDTSVRARVSGPQEVEEMARAFNAMAERIERQEASYRVYLSSVAHDLRNPVHVLRGAVSLDSLVSEPSQAKRILGIVERQLGQIERLVDDVVDTENLRHGRLTIRRGEHDLTDIAQSVATLFTGTSNTHPIEIIAPGPINASCDAERIEEVLTNLVSNAIKYSPNGGRIRIALGATPASARIVVSDEGIGMTEKQSEEAFGAFERGATVRDKIPGRGLGLFVTRKIVEEHGGTIGVKTTLGRGSSFVIELPLREPPQPSETTSLIVDASEGSRATSTTAASTMSGAASRGGNDASRGSCLPGGGG